MGTTERSRRATNLTLDEELLADAKRLGVNLSRAAEDGLQAAVRQARIDEWMNENAAAIESSNGWVEKRGLPLARHRQF
ncbi:MAG: type II toxin-antitoxin system CcdA family antitoxin [Pseudomonadota bacterium]